MIQICVAAVSFLNSCTLLLCRITGSTDQLRGQRKAFVSFKPCIIPRISSSFSPYKPLFFFPPLPSPKSHNNIVGKEGFLYISSRIISRGEKALFVTVSSHFFFYVKMLFMSIFLYAWMNMVLLYLDVYVYSDPAHIAHTWGHYCHIIEWMHFFCYFNKLAYVNRNEPLPPPSPVMLKFCSWLFLPPFIPLWYFSFYSWVKSRSVASVFLLKTTGWILIPSPPTPLPPTSRQTLLLSLNDIALVPHANSHSRPTTWLVANLAKPLWLHLAKLAAFEI